ncbi:hypothetical protein FRB90_008797 [Tulasnella sp. 427]|nr:hypothetical protein FRB90_008797 [Tulasnella sp. 427]
MLSLSSAPLQNSQQPTMMTRPPHPPPFALPDTLAFQRRPARSPSSGRRTPASRSAHASPARGAPAVAQIPLPPKFTTAPQPHRQQPRHPRKVLDVSYDVSQRNSRPSSPPLLLSTNVKHNFVDTQRVVPADKVYTLHSTYYPDFPPASSSYSSSSSFSSPRTKASRLPLWNTDSKDSLAEEDADIPVALKQTAQWQALMAAPKPSPKGKEKATGRVTTTAAGFYAGAGRGRRLGSDSNQRRRGYSLATPQIAIVSATYQAQSLLQAGVRPTYFDGDLSPPNSQRSKSLSPLRDSSSTSPSSSSTASSSSSRSTSPSSSTSTLVTDPDPSPRSCDGVVVVVGAECQSPRCFRTRQLSLTVEESDIIEESTQSLITFPTAKSAVTPSLSLDAMASYGTPRGRVARSPYVRVPFGRDPLSRGPTRLDMTDLVGSVAATMSEKVVGSETPRSSKSKAAKITSLLYSALDALANLGVGQIMVDGYSTTGSYEDEEYPREKRPRRPVLVERDSLGLEKATLSPGESTPTSSLLLVSPGTPAPASSSNSSKSPVRPRNHTRRRSLRHVSSDPILYHHHARAPSIQKRKQAFGPLDIKPYGYRVGSNEVTSVFGEKEEKKNEVSKEKETSGLGSAFFDMLASASAAAMMMEGEVVASASAVASSAPGSPRSSPSRPPSPPTPACVALQRYPIIPYNPPGPGVSAADELFPKIRDLTKGRLWYLELIPGGSDGKIDADVPLSFEIRETDDAGVLFTSFPDPLRAVGSTHYGLKQQAQCMPVRRRPSEGDRRRARSPYADRPSSERARSPSPQRGRPRNVRPVTGSQHIRIPAQLKPLSPSPPPTPSPRARALSARPLSGKHFRAPPLAEQPSTYLLWAVKGSILALPAGQQQQQQHVDAMMEGWNGVVVRKGGNSARRSSSSAGASSGGGGSPARRCGPAGAEGLRGTAKRRVGADGRIWSALRWEVPVYGSSDVEDEDGVL